MKSINGVFQPPVTLKVGFSRQTPCCESFNSPCNGVVAKRVHMKVCCALSCQLWPQEAERTGSPTTALRTRPCRSSRDAPAAYSEPANPLAVSCWVSTVSASRCGGQGFRCTCWVPPHLLFRLVPYPELTLHGHTYLQGKHRFPAPLPPTVGRACFRAASSALPGYPWDGPLQS